MLITFCPRSSLSCALPLQSFCIVSGLLLLLMGVVSFLLLNFKREAASNDLDFSAEEILALPRWTSIFGLLTYLRIVCMFGLIWGMIGLNWTFSSTRSCDLRIVQVD